MVVPISFNPNYFPDRPGKKVTGRKDEQVNFEDYLLEKIEPVDSSPEPGRDQDDGSGQRDDAGKRQDSPDEANQRDSHGGDRPDRPRPGRRIDLRA